MTTWSIDRNRWPILFLGALALGISGCASVPKEYDRDVLGPTERQFVESKPVVLQAGFRNLFEEGRRNKVLNLMEIGITAYRAGYRDEAMKTLEQARIEIESVYSDNEAARRARSIWYEEAEKDFKGEPYERAMVYFYLGLLYLEVADYGNARASFMSGLLQDAFAEEKQNSSDFAAFLYLAGWCALRMGDEKLAQEHFKEFRLYRPDAPLPQSSDNTLLIVETGLSPRKLGDGVGHYQLVYRRGKGFDDVAAQFFKAGQWQTVYPVEDLFFQASTRGGRAIDRIVDGQIQFKENTRAVGTNLSVVTQDATLAGVSTAAGGGLGVGFAALSLISVAADGMSATANVRADVRYWRGLPDTIHISPIEATAGDAIPVRFLDKQGSLVPGLTDTATVTADENGAGVAFATSRRPNTGVRP
ncbi:hypothetical protein [Marinobacter nauticus]|uniref:hypothetical protein n=1 Tax=Marinobacter nauticus TaxID=2743 RepID=UPI001D0DB141|nr:hypothetical protein [Marinobacter nauticus]